MESNSKKNNLNKNKNKTKKQLKMHQEVSKTTKQKLQSAQTIILSIQTTDFQKNQTHENHTKFSNSATKFRISNANIRSVVNKLPHNHTTATNSQNLAPIKAPKKVSRVYQCTSYNSTRTTKSESIQQ